MNRKAGMERLVAARRLAISPLVQRTDWPLLVAGVGFTLLVAALGFALAQLPGLRLAGPLACSIVLAVGYRQVAGYPEQLRGGIQFSAKRLLRAAIILYGLKLNIAVVLHQGLGLLLRDAFTIIFALGVTMLLARWLKADRSMALLLGIGTGICGAAAIAAISPIVGAEEEDTAISVGIIALLGTLFALAYTALRVVLPLTSEHYGVWVGVSLHEIAQVALAAAPAGQNALAIALLAKLGRVFLLVPVSLLAMWWMQRRASSTEQE
nr:putative sulfate exporter family transporter [Ktedonobacterales bacterium]